MEDERAAVRAAVFTHLAGIVLAPTVSALAGRGVFRLFDPPSLWLTLEEIAERTHANRGYLRVALRLLTSCSWLRQRRVENGEAPQYALTAEGMIALRLAPPLYGEVTSFIPKALFLEDFLFGKSDFPVLPSLQWLVQQAQERWIGDSGLDCDEVGRKVRGLIRAHLDGMLIGPAMVALARGGILARLERGPVDSRELPAKSGQPQFAIRSVGYAELACARRRRSAADFRRRLRRADRNILRCNGFLPADVQRAEHASFWKRAVFASG